MYTSSAFSDNIWLWTPDLGWLWTTESLYPYLYSSSEGAWLWYQRGSSSPRWFYNYGTGSWESH